MFIVKLFFGLSLPDDTLCKESIVIEKKFDLEILTYLCDLKCPEIIYTVFMLMHVCVYACVYE